MGRGPERAHTEGTLGVYELNQFGLLRDVFLWTYERSCQRYVAIMHEMFEPYPLKIKYREALIHAVQKVVRRLRASGHAVIAKMARDHAAEEATSGLNDWLGNIVGIPQRETKHVKELDAILEYRLRVIINEEVTINGCNPKAMPLVEGKLIAKCTGAYLYLI